MKAFALAALLLVSGCVMSDPEPAPVIEVDKPPPHPTAPVTPKPVLNLAQHFTVTAQKAASVVTAPNVTPDFVQHVRVAEVNARNAVAALGHQRQHPSAEALRRAQVAVHQFDSVISHPPSESTP